MGTSMNYLDTVNHPNFREAGLKVHEVRQLLYGMGLTQEQAYGWIKAWASGAGDGESYNEDFSMKPAHKGNADLLGRQAQENALIELTRESERLGLYERGPLKRGKTGTCLRTPCQCEAEGLGDECVWLTRLYAAPPAQPALTDEEMKLLSDYIKQVQTQETRPSVPEHTWQQLYRKAINEANGLTNYVEDRPELYSAEKRLNKIEAAARDLQAWEEARK